MDPSAASLGGLINSPVDRRVRREQVAVQLHECMSRLWPCRESTSAVQLARASALTSIVKASRAWLHCHNDDFDMAHTYRLGR